MRKFILVLLAMVLGACGGVPDQAASVSEALTYSATMAIKPGTTCSPTGTAMQLLPDPLHPNPYLTKVTIAKSTADSGYWQNSTGFTPYTDTAVVTATEWTAYCTTINAAGKNSQVTVYWDGNNCPNGHCQETQSPVITNL